jgi:hypothetical protein
MFRLDHVGKAIRDDEDPANVEPLERGETPRRCDRRAVRVARST